MKICVFRGMTVRVHPLFIVMMTPFFLLGEAGVACTYLFTLFLHECGHFFAAAKLRLQIAQLEITPFGGCMQLDLPDALPSGKAFLLSAAGPAVNAACLAGGFLLSLYSTETPAYLVYFIAFHAAMLLLNLLPVLPLDGGRMLLAVLSRKRDRKRMRRLLLLLGRIIAVLLVCTGAVLTVYGYSAFSLCLMGFYLLYAAALEEKTGTSRYLAAFISRRVRLEKEKTLPVQRLAAASDMPLFLLIPHLQPGAYHIVDVVQADACTNLGQLQEEKLLHAVLTDGSMTLGELLLQ